MGWSGQDAFALGSVVGDYRIDALIGEGGSAAVFAARRLSDGAPVAVKVMHVDIQREPEMHARFLREAETAARIQSAHAARVLDMGTLPPAKGGAPYIVFERLEGNDLADVLDARGALPLAEAVGWVLEACHAVGEAHALGIVHRDLKPENLFLARRADGRSIVKVIDFGISKIVQPTWVGRELSLTRSQVVMGSPKYMAPEQLRAASSADARSDVWSLGVVLYELLAGRAPFEATTLADLCAAVLKETPMPLGALRPDAPRALEAVVMRCLERDANLRFADAGALGDALARLDPNELAHAPASPRPSRRPGSFHGTVPPVAGTIAPPRSGWSKRFLAFASLAVVLLGLSIAAKRFRQPPERAELWPRSIVSAADSAARSLPSAEPSVAPAEAPAATSDATARAASAVPAPRPPRRRPPAPAPAAATPARPAPTFKVPLWGRD